MTGLRDALAATVHERCTTDWEMRFKNGALAVTMHGPDAHLELADDLLARPPLASLLAVAEAARAGVEYSMQAEDGGYCRVCGTYGTDEDPHDFACWVGAAARFLAALPGGGS